MAWVNEPRKLNMKKCSTCKTPAKCKKAGKCLKSGSSKVRSYSMTKGGKSKSGVKSYSMTKGKCGSKSKNSFKAGMSIGRNMKKKKK